MPWPHITRYTDDLPEDVGGEARGLLVRIRLKYQDDQGIHAHEYEHVRQWWTAFIVVAALIVAGAMTSEMPMAAAFAPIGLAAHSLAYVLSPAYRLWSEARAYREQMRYPNRKGAYLSLDDAAARIAGERYKLGIDVAQARARLASL